MEYKQIKKCVQCGKEYECYISNRHKSHKIRYKRPCNSKNCSTKCSREYNAKRWKRQRLKNGTGSCKKNID